jgi:MFS family permease
MSAMIGANVSSDTFGRSFGITTSAMCLGFALGPLAGGAMASTMGLRWPFVIMGVLQIVCALLIALYVRPQGQVEDVNDVAAK